MEAFSALFCPSIRKAKQRLMLQHAHKDRQNNTDGHRLSKIEQLPPEILLEITDYCAPESVVTLSLASKRLYKDLFVRAKRACDDWPSRGRVYLPTSPSRLPFNPRFNPLPSHSRPVPEPCNKVRLLLLLERDFPKYVTCTTCARMYRWKTSMPRLHPHACRWGHPTRASLCDDTNRNYESLAIEQRDLILRAVDLGPKYGIPLSRLEKTFSLHERGGVKIHRTWLPRVRDGYLMLWKTATLDLSLVRPLYPQVRQLWWSVCRHSDLFMESIINCALDHFRDSEPSPPVDGRGTLTVPKCFRLIQCVYCATDFQLEVMRWCSPSKVTLRIHAWMDFGARDTSLMSPQGVHFAPNFNLTATRRRVWRVESDLREKFGRDCYPEGFEPAHHKRSTCILDMRNLRGQFLSADA